MLQVRLVIWYSIGVPKHIAVSVFTLSIGAAMYINNVLFVQFQVFFPKIEWGLRYQKFGFTAMLVQMGITIAFILYNRKKIQKVRLVICKSMVKPL